MSLDFCWFHNCEQNLAHDKIWGVNSCKKDSQISYQKLLLFLLLTMSTNSRWPCENNLLGMENWKLITNKKGFRGWSFITFTNVNASSILSPLTCSSIIRLNIFCVEELWFRSHQIQITFAKGLASRACYSRALLNLPKALIKLT